MSTNPSTQYGAELQSRRERGSALLLALIMIIILTFLGFGLLTRSLLVSQIAGAERWTTKAFFAADAGISVAKARLKILRTDDFTFQIQDLRGERGTGQHGWIRVDVSEFNPVGPPQMVEGNQTGGGQETGSVPLFSRPFGGTATSQATLTRSEAVVRSTQSVWPVPVNITGGS